MYSAGFPDWKKIGKDIGKRLRDILGPPTDHGPSKEERSAQRLRDVLKGFAYFDNFDELQEWSEKDVDPIQCANTPLLKRSEVHEQEKITSRLLLCHDYNGGYHDYESVRPPVSDEKMYSCNYLEYVETFIYFSHKLVCVPPPTWTNLLHRHGVKTLGTFIIESDAVPIERMLSQENGEYTVAKQLAAISRTFSFDGWLLNIESPFPTTPNLPQKLTSFILTLKHHLPPSSLVIWYDALTTSNKVDYQNSLTHHNLPFAQAADALFTNYKWTPQTLQSSLTTAQAHNLPLPSLYFGIDMWAQNHPPSNPPRITFPRDGGGGTLTGLAIGALAAQGVSAAVFAPAWTYEHFPPSATSGESVAAAVEEAVWEGRPLPAELACGCVGEPHRRAGYETHPITKFARKGVVEEPRRARGQRWGIEDVRVVERVSGDVREKRVAWRWSGEREQWPEGMPWSGAMGPFERFVVEIGGARRGEAWCLEFPLREGDFEGVGDGGGGGGVEGVVTGVLWGGGEVRGRGVIGLGGD